MRAATVAVHRSASAKAADLSPGAHNVPRKAARMPHCQQHSGWLLGRSHAPSFVGHIKLVAKKQLPITKERSGDPRVIMRKTWQSYWLTVCLESTFLHSAPKTDASAAMITGGELMLVVNPTSYKSSGGNARVNFGTWANTGLSSVLLPQGCNRYTDYDSQVCFSCRHSDHSLDHILLGQESS